MSYDVFFIESMSNGTKHGIGTYATNLLPTLSGIDSNLNLYYIKIFFTKKPSVKKVNNNENFTTIEINFSEQKLENKEEIVIQPIVVRHLLCIISPYFKQNRVTIFHLNSALHYPFISILKEYNFKVIYTQHVSLWRVFYNNNIEKFKADWGSRNNEKGKNSTYLNSIEVEKKVFDLSDKIICLTKDSSQFAETYFHTDNAKISIIQNGIHINKGNSSFSDRETKRTVLKAKLGFNHSDFIFLFVGRLTPQKGINALIKSFITLVQATGNPDFRLLIVGSGNTEEYISMTSEICGKVSFTGYLNSEKMEQFYAIADVGVLPSCTEQSSFVALEMLSNKIPLVTSDISAFEYPFEHAKNILKIKTDKYGNVDITDLTNCLLNLYKNHELKDSLSKNGYNLAMEYFTNTIMASKTIDVYKNAIENSPPIIQNNKV